jgi:HD-GYP domain-containing protein (c-di-GMP phosphodiesterase class II)
MSLIGRFEGSDWSRPKVMNHLGDTALGAEYPGLESLVIVPIGTLPQAGGWILSWNLRQGCEYGTVEASWLNSVATIFGTHLRNIELFKENADLLVSFVRSLVSTLDAKDPYTRGHSERVALIARRIAQAMDLPNAELKDIYLAGLLHDLGKIGVDDSILRKPGSLTREEFAEIQKHPGVGFSILKGIKNLQSILPGVRNHHESYNGTGYPDGLKGDEIPLMARILAVADSYDAMGSDRPYRKGMPVETIHDIFRRGAGQQWDERVIEAYFSAWTDISRICAEYTDGETGLLIPQPHDELVEVSP